MGLLAWLFWFFVALGSVSGKTKCAKCVGSKFFLCGGLFLFFFLCRACGLSAVTLLVSGCPAIATNGKSICEERATLQTISKENRFEQKLFLPTKLVKNRRVEKFFADTAKSFLKDSIHPVFCQYTVICSCFIHRGFLQF